MSSDTGDFVSGVALSREVNITTDHKYWGKGLYIVMGYVCRGSDFATTYYFFSLSLNICPVASHVITWDRGMVIEHKDKLSFFI